MQILFHLGAHCTDDGLLIRSVLRNRAVLANEGIGVPGPSRYRELLGDVSTTLRGEQASEDTEQMLVDAIRDDDTAERIVLSSENFICRDKVVLSEDGLYSKAGKSAWLRNCFPSHDVEFAIAIRNPASFIPDVLARLPENERDEVFTSFRLETASWADVIADISAANPGAPISVWCHEDTPFIWAELIRELTAHDPYTVTEGGLDMIAQIMSETGFARLQDFLNGHSDLTESQRRRTISAFLEAHALKDEIENEVDLPGWTRDTVDVLSELYEEDLRQISKMSGVTFVQP
ncbi:MAG: hypothetical protein OXQ92_09935 [Boseongicola sp.]|nr:hypothetical protein [Boseongicola sp.]MDD9978969.1 hypothetical protein [Boseongicola sp.]